MKPFAFRLTKSQEVKSFLQDYAHNNNVSGSIFSGAGCLSQVEIRLAGAQSTLKLDERLEIVSLMGTLTPDHIHIHISVANSEGSVVGGHLISGVADLTVEIMGAEFDEYQFSTQLDPTTGYKELQIRKK